MLERLQISGNEKRRKERHRHHRDHHHHHSLGKAITKTKINDESKVRWAAINRRDDNRRYETKTKNPLIRHNSMYICSMSARNKKNEGEQRRQRTKTKWNRAVFDLSVRSRMCQVCTVPVSNFVLPAQYKLGANFTCVSRFGCTL